MSTVIDCPSCQRKLRVPQEFVGKSVRCPTCGETFDAAEPAAGATQAGDEAEAVAAAEPSPLLTVPINLELDAPPAPRPAAEEPPQKEAAPPRREPEKRDERDDRRGSRRRKRRDFEPCPRCDEDVRRGAVVCPFCGLDLEEQGDGYTRRQPVRRDAEPHRGGVIQTLGILSLVAGVIWFFFWIGLPLGITAWVMGHRDLRKMQEGTMDPNGRKKTRDGRLCGIVGTVLCSLIACGILFVIFISIMAAEEPRPPHVRQAGPWGNGPAWQNNPPGVQKQPARPQGNRFTLRGPQVVTNLKRGETKTVTINIDRVPGWRGNVTVSPEDAEELDGLDVVPGEVRALGGQGAVTFKVKADANANLGEQTITFSATDDDEDEVSLDVRVKVIGGR